MDRGTVVPIRRDVSDMDLELRARTLPLPYRERLRTLVDTLRMTRDVMALRASVYASADLPPEHSVWPAYSDAASELFGLLSRVGLVVPADWRAWAVTLPARDHLSHASVAEAVRYVTVVVRSERHGDRCFAASIIDGSLLDALGVIIDHV